MERPNRPYMKVTTEMPCPTHTEVIKFLTSYGWEETGKHVGNGDGAGHLSEWQKKGTEITISLQDDPKSSGYFKAMEDIVRQITRIEEEDEYWVISAMHSIVPPK